MMHVVAVGRLRGGPEAELFARYQARIRPKLALTEVPEASGSPVEIKRREGAALLAAVPASSLVVALDLGGEAPDSEGFASRLERWLQTGRPVSFVVGGAAGLDAAVLARADHALSLGRMTWPHFLVRPMLAEQIYRARAISAGHPYHRAGRPAGDGRTRSGAKGPRQCG
jgi:23S rRNA (pseudouridine1915-N3)-methyltransferase